MHLKNWFYRQRVTEAELDQVFTWAQDADRAIVLDKDEAGVADGLTLAETGPASMSLAYASGVAYAKAGERCNVAVAGTVDCSQDEYGVPTTVTDPANTKWIAIFVRPTRVLSEPRTDGNGNEVYTVQSEAAEVFVRQGSEGIGPAQVGLSASAILLGEVELAFGQTAITTGDIEVDRREDWYRAVTISFGDKVHGTAHDAVAELWAEMDILGAAGGTFTFVSKWFSAVDVAGSAPPITTVAEAINAMVYDLAQSTGSGLVGTANVAGTYVNWTGASVAGALTSIATAVNQHIGGSAPQHPATSITYTPYSWIAGATVAAAINEMIDDLALTTGTPGAARVGNLVASTTAWDWFTVSAGTLQAQIASIIGAINNALPVNQINVNPTAKTDGSDSAYYGAFRGLVAPAPSASWKNLIEQNYGHVGASNSVGSAVPWAAPNYYDSFGREYVDVCPGWHWNHGQYGMPCFFLVSFDQAKVYKLDHIGTNTGGIGNCTSYVDWSGTYPTAMPQAVACNGQYLYVLTSDSSTHRARILQYDLYTDPLSTPTLYKTEYFDAIELWDGSNAAKTSIAMGNETLAFTAKHSTGPLTADEFLVIVAQKDVTSWSHGVGNIAPAAGYDDVTGALCHIGGEAYLYGVRDLISYLACAAQGTVVGGLVTGVVTPTLGPAAVKSIGLSSFQSCIFDGASAWLITEGGDIHTYQHLGSAASEAERWQISMELTTNNLIDQTAGTKTRLAFDGARVWIAARAYGLSRIVMGSFDPTLTYDPVFFPSGMPARLDLIFLNPPATTSWASNGPAAGEGPGKIAILADVAIVIGRLDPADGILHRVVNLSRRGGRYL